MRKSASSSSSWTPRRRSGAEAALPLMERGRSVQAYDVAVLVEVDADGGRLGGQAGHGAHLAADRVDEAGADRGAVLADRQPEPRRRALQRRVVGQRQVRLGEADGQVAEAVLLVAVELP